LEFCGEVKRWGN